MSMRTKVDGYYHIESIMYMEMCNRFEHSDKWYLQKSSSKFRKLDKHWRLQMQKPSVEHRRQSVAVNIVMEECNTRRLRTRMVCMVANLNRELWLMFPNSNVIRWCWHIHSIVYCSIFWMLIWILFYHWTWLIAFLRFSRTFLMNEKSSWRWPSVETAVSRSLRVLRKFKTEEQHQICIYVLTVGLLYDAFVGE